jgi:hypothetical protein
MRDCPASDQSGTGIKKLTMPGQVRYRIKPRQSGIFMVRYQTEIIDAGMPVLVSWMPMPSYVHKDEPPEAVVIVAALSSYFTKAPLK